MKKNKPTRDEICDSLADSYGYIKRVLAVKGATPDLQEELAQAAIFEGYKRINQLRDPEKIKPWLATVAKRLLIRECKRNDIMFTYQNSETEDVEDFINMIPSDEDILEDMIRSETNAKLMKMVHQLDSRHSSIIILRYVDEMSFKDIAVAMDMNYSTVRSLHNRALAKLKRLMEGEKGEADYGKQR